MNIEFTLYAYSKQKQSALLGLKCPDSKSCIDYWRGEFTASCFFFIKPGETYSPHFSSLSVV